jgi:3-oxoacyl-[acyl-carrier protein] reductase
MSMHLAERTALVTGAASGIGMACAKRLAEEGLKVAAVDLQAEPLKKIAGEMASVHALDVTDFDAVQSAVADIGRIDVVVNSAGIIGPQLPIWEVPIESWERTLAVNLTGTFNTIKATMAGMRERGWGRIVNIASIAGKEGNPNMVAYSASKAAVIGLTKSVGKEACTEGVLVNAIAPAVIATPMNADTEPDVLEYMLGKIPMRRLGLVDEVAELVSWLSSDSCSFSTAAVYDISGGRATY